MTDVTALWLVETIIATAPEIFSLAMGGMENVIDLRKTPFWALWLISVRIAEPYLHCHRE